MMNLPCTQLVDVCDLQCRRGILSFGLIQCLVQSHIVLSFLNQVLHYRCSQTARIFSFGEVRQPIWTGLCSILLHLYPQLLKIHYSLVPLKSSRYCYLLCPGQYGIGQLHYPLLPQTILWFCLQYTMFPYSISTTEFKTKKPMRPSTRLSHRLYLYNLTFLQKC